ncbi:hypothetical protein ARMSODRAFT_977477 [Armillaria solidipes]|uniref:Uncharacterized protein n=1 Tax=Armillaria solidipes TaxID=1076256 RepID=A0A2H3BKI5_9AGAR|nr:hypothetical protein ARMSODRAFT_977477 [Armillaria solidipes]
MSLTSYKAPDTLAASIQQESFTTAPLSGQPGDLGLHDSAESILDTFVVDTVSSDDFVFLANESSGEEEVFQVRGVVSEVKLPPVLKAQRVSINELTQTVKIISIDDDEWFRKASSAASRIAEFMEQHVQETVRIPYAIRHGAIREFQFVNRLLMPAHRTAAEDVIELPPAYDPSHTLQAVINEGKFVYTKDNKPAFEKFSLNEDGQYTRVRGVKPGTYRPGQIVAIGVSFRLVRSTNSDTMMFVAHLDSVALLSWGVMKNLDDNRATRHRAQKHVLPIKKRHTNLDDHMAPKASEENNQVHPQAKNQNNPFGPTAENMHAYYYIKRPRTCDELITFPITAVIRENCHHWTLITRPSIATGKI